MCIFIFFIFINLYSMAILTNFHLHQIIHLSNMTDDTNGDYLTVLHYFFYIQLRPSVNLKQKSDWRLIIVTLIDLDCDTLLVLQ